MANKAVVETEARQYETELDEIRQYVRRSLDELHIVGAAVGIVKDDKVILSEGFGLRDREQALPVTTDTLFAIGSSTKAFTTMSVGMLVDEGKLDWDAPVSSYIPEFKLYDTYATENATLRDLATHRVGLPRHEFVWYKAPLSREEIVKRLVHLPFTKPFRTTFQYQNMMYLTLGYLVEKISGQTWESFVQERILDKLGMERTNFSVHDSKCDVDHAKPYKTFGREVREIPFADIDAMAPAGAINSSVAEMVAWVKLHLNQGKAGEFQLVSETNVAQMHAPYMPTGMALDERILFPSYGLGWFTEVYQGHQVVHHGGNIDGFSAIVAMIPKEKIGVVVLVNQEVSVFPRAAIYTIFDALLGHSSTDWNPLLKEQLEKLMAAMAGEGQDAADRISDTKLSHEALAYTGEFEHPAYGTVTITYEDDAFYVSYHAFPHRVLMKHHHYDVFSLEIAVEGDIAQHYQVQFHTDLDGEIRRFTMDFESPLEPFEFVRKN